MLDEDDIGSPGGGLASRDDAAPDGTVKYARVSVVVVGGGPAGLAAAIAASDKGASTLIVEREARLGGILKQCVHDGFGVVRYGEKLAGPEYACREIRILELTKAHVMTQTFISRIEKKDRTFLLTLISSGGVTQVEADSLVLATGARERTARQISIHGDKPAGIFTAGNAQYYTNILGQMPTKRCVILGSGDIGLIMARRLTLEGAKVIGVFDAKPAPGGLFRNVVQCLYDYDIPLYLSHTVTRVFGTRRLNAVEVCRLDKQMNIIPGTEQTIPCDALILSVGLIPENELAESIGVEMSDQSHGPVCDQNNMTMIDGVFSCGNALHINDIVDYVSESGEIAGRAAAAYTGQARELVSINASGDFQYVTPQYLDIKSVKGETVLFFRSAQSRGKTAVRVNVGGREVFHMLYDQMRPPEMERISVDFGDELRVSDKITIKMEPAK